MSKEKIEDSPLARRKFTLGAAQPEPAQPEETETKHNNVKTSKHKDIKMPNEKSVTMKRTTVYIPEELAIKLKVYAARHKEDVSGIITRQIEKLLAEEE
jgi:hypothetical protein